MDKFDYPRAREIAKGLIDKFGAEGTIVVKGQEGGYDDYGDPLPDVPDESVTGLVTPLLSFKKDEIDGSSILNTDSYVYFYTDETPIVAGVDWYYYFSSLIAADADIQITLNGNAYRVIAVYELTSVDGINVYTKLHLRR